MIEKCVLDDKEIDRLIEFNNTVFNKSNFKMFKAHKGLRPGRLHLITGMPSAGKSTLRNSIIFDYIENNPGKKVFLWLSEEKAVSYRSALSNNRWLKEKSKNVFLYSEKENRFHGSIQEKRDHFFETVIKTNCDFFIFDNITTSRLYTGNVESQAEFAMDLNEMFDDSDSVCLVFAHTPTEIKQSHRALIDANDIHGSRAIVKLAEYQYVMQKFEIGDRVFTTVRIVKHRDQDVDKKMYLFHFDKNRKCYDVDGGIHFEEFKRLYEKTNRL